MPSKPQQKQADDTATATQRRSTRGHNTSNPNTMTDNSSSPALPPTETPASIPTETSILERLLAAIDDLKNTFQSNNSILSDKIARTIPQPIPTPTTPDKSELLDAIETSFQETTQTNNAVLISELATTFQTATPTSPTPDNSALLIALHDSTAAATLLNETLQPPSSDSSNSMPPIIPNITDKFEELHGNLDVPSETHSVSIADLHHNLQRFIRELYEPFQAHLGRSCYLTSFIRSAIT